MTGSPFHAPAALAACLFLAACAGHSTAAGPVPQAPEAITLTDAARGRDVPVLLYGVAKRPRPLALVSHGYGGRNSAYSFIARHLAARGFVVASVQHELPGDAALPTEGEPAVVRRPSWAQGARSLVFVAETLRARGVAAGGAVVLVGHSHGGDTSLLLAAEQPDFARAVFTLDSRRMAFPRTAAPRICSVRSSDQVADPGVLPDAAEAARLGMVILAVPGLAHNDMWDGATEAQKQAVLAALDRCLGPER